MNVKAKEQMKTAVMGTFGVVHLGLCFFFGCIIKALFISHLLPKL
jgi:hypothetical protein